jgi:flavin reductase (DIM6/NTAB) family NADH-FMN oxidoreductase RutF
MNIDSESLRKTMRLWVSGISIVTSAHDNQRAGVTASSFTSVALEPPLILVCLQDYITTYKMIEDSGIFAVSLLKADQAHLSAQFAGQITLPEGEDRFYRVDTMTQVTGAPILTDALAWMDCRLHAIYPAGKTGIIVGEVLATGQHEGENPLAYHNRHYYDLQIQHVAEEGGGRVDG